MPQRRSDFFGSESVLGSRMPSDVEQPGLGDSQSLGVIWTWVILVGALVAIRLLWEMAE